MIKGSQYRALYSEKYWWSPTLNPSNGWRALRSPAQQEAFCLLNHDCGALLPCRRRHPTTAMPQTKRATLRVDHGGNGSRERQPAEGSRDCELFHFKNFALYTGCGGCGRVLGVVFACSLSVWLEGVRSTNRGLRKWRSAGRSGTCCRIAANNTNWSRSERLPC